MVASTARPAAVHTGLPAVVSSAAAGGLSRISAGPDRRRQRQATAEHLAERDDVGCDAVVFEGVQGARPAEAHLDLVADHRHAVPAAQLVQAGEEAVGRHDQAAVGQDRLDDQAGDGAAAQMLLGEVEAGGDVGVDRHRAPGRKGLGYGRNTASGSGGAPASTCTPETPIATPTPPW